jgi:hypothetical protein
MLGHSQVPSRSTLRQTSPHTTPKHSHERRTGQTHSDASNPRGVRTALSHNYRCRLCRPTRHTPPTASHHHQNYDLSSSPHGTRTPILLQSATGNAGPLSDSDAGQGAMHLERTVNTPVFHPERRAVDVNRPVTSLVRFCCGAGRLVAHRYRGNDIPRSS